MLIRDYTARHCRWVEQHEKLAAIRRRVFIEEQNVDETLEWDGKDLEATHFLIENPAGDAVGCARLLNDGKVGRMAILKPFRGCGLGKKLMQYILSFARESGYTRLYLDAQLHALPFYQRLGFDVCSEEFEDAGIPHKTMQIEPVPQILCLGFSREKIVLHKNKEYPELLRQMALQAKFRVCVFSYQLNPELFGQAGFAHALSEMARSYPRSKVDILIRESRDLAKQSHPLVSLSRSLPDKVQIRLLERRPEAYSEEFVLADNTGLMLRKNHKEDHGYFCFNQPHKNQALLESFDDMWHRSYLDKRLKPV